MTDSPATHPSKRSDLNELICQLERIAENELGRYLDTLRMDCNEKQMLSAEPERT